MGNSLNYAFAKFDCICVYMDYAVAFCAQLAYNQEKLFGGLLMSKKLTAVVIGAGNRGLVYAKLMAERPEKYEIVAVAEPKDSRRNEVKTRSGLPQERCFTHWRDLLALGKIADIAVIATMDQDHLEPALAAIDAGYDILLEKPVAPTAAECERIARRAEEKGTKILVCHVLRYAPFFTTLKRLLTEGAVGTVCSIDHQECVGIIHQSHSFVRGRWGNEGRSSCMLLQKSCHDLDILQWLVDKKCLKIQSFGTLRHFTKENMPLGAPERCIDGCPHGDSCIFNSVKLYLKSTSEWFRGACTGIVNASDEEVEQALRTNQYGVCVYRCDNDVVDRQTVNMLFEDGITVTFSMNAFNKGGRHIHIFGTEGELWGSMDSKEEPIRVYRFDTKQVTEYPVTGKDGLESGHGGGDKGIIEALYEYMNGTYTGFSASDVRTSVDNHHLVFAAEQSRLQGTVVTLADYIAQL